MQDSWHFRSPVTAQLFSLTDSSAHIESCSHEGKSFQNCLGGRGQLFCFVLFFIISSHFTLCWTQELNSICYITALYQIALETPAEQIFQDFSTWIMGTILEIIFSQCEKYTGGAFTDAFSHHTFLELVFRNQVLGGQRGVT